VRLTLALSLHSEASALARNRHSRTWDRHPWANDNWRYQAIALKFRLLSIHFTSEPLEKVRK
jgi:hypothetical protein